MFTDCLTPLGHGLKADESAEDVCLILEPLLSMKCVRLTMLRGIYESH